VPTYVCYSHAGAITPEQQQQLASAITDAHCRATGAPVSFTQVIFRDLTPSGHFIGGRPAGPDSLWVHGTIRDGRPDSVKSDLVRSLTDLIERVTGAGRENTWVYISELPAQQMIEFGQVLPPHGEEDTWMRQLPGPLRDRLQAFETAG
jgi:phenylpyruvate tautomerase PptA (4-oxalocrotonate tautomerase family)